MTPDIDIYTETMAQVYADQGHWEKVAEIYRHLLAKEPARLDFAKALDEAEKRIEGNREDVSERLVSQLREWIDLMFKYEKLEKLKKLKRKF